MRNWSLYRSIRSLVCIAILASATQTVLPGVGRAERGRWTPLQNLGQAIHLALLRGDGSPYHSRILWWGHYKWVGGEMGWVPGNDDCGALPLTTFTPILGLWSPGADIFCNGFCTLASGDLLSFGGSDNYGPWGITDARRFTPGTGTDRGGWTPLEKMRYARFYPTATLLSNGAVLASWGSRYEHLWLFGGRPDGAAPNPITGHRLYRFGRGTGAIWDPPVTPGFADQGERPGPREGHSAAMLRYGPGQGKRGMAIFGGRDAAGNTDDNAVWHMSRSPGGTLDADYGYRWDRIPISGQAPVGRAEHVAVSLSETEMVILGGIERHSTGSETLPLAFAWHLRKPTGSAAWIWSQVQVDSGTPPTGRYGHAAVYDDATRKLYLLGGSEAWNQSATDTRVYEFTFTHGPNSPARGWWRELPVTGTPPAARRDHAMVFDGTVRSLLVYGGTSDGATGDATLWRLDLSRTPAVWSAIPTHGDSPGARFGHIAYYDDFARRSVGRMTVFGGQPVAGGPLDPCPYTIEPFTTAPGGPVWTRAECGTTGLTGHTGIGDPTGYLMARTSEVYTPGRGWTDTQAPWFQANDHYPIHFVVPGDHLPGGARVLAVGPDSVARTLDLDLNGRALLGWQEVPNGNSGFVALSGVMFRPGQVMIAGGIYPDGLVTGRTLSMDATGTSGWQAHPPMEPRFHHNLVLLPTGDVLATGGQNTFRESYHPDLAVHTPQIWSPTTGRWSDTTGADRLARDEAVRNYHSAALLLPDGRVLSAGGENNGAFDQKVNIFCPPYLFVPGSDPPELAVRPVISAAPDQITYGQTFTIGTPAPEAIGSVCLMRAGTTTHSFDQNQRYVPLQFEVETGATLRVAAPASGSLAPPGDYLLFILDRSQVPAIARWVRLGDCPSIPCDTDPPPGVTNLEIDVIGPDRAWLVWDAPGDDLRPISGVYDVRCSAGGILGELGYEEATPVEGEPPVGPAGGPVTFGAGPLSPCVRYDFALKTRDGTGAPGNWSPLSNVVSATTLCGGASEHPAADEEYVPRAERLVVETSRTGERGWQVTVRRLARIEGVDAGDDAAIVSQEPDGNGGWKTLGRARPAPEEGPLGLCALRDGGRMVLPRGYALERVAGSINSGARPMRLSLARHSRRGMLDGDVAGGEALDVAPDEVLTLSYSPEAAASGPTSWYVLVRPVGGAMPALGPDRGPLAGRIPVRFALHPNQPNPFRHATTIAFDLPVASPVTLEVFDLLGRRVASLARGRYPAGTHAVEWDLRASGERPVRPGVYVCRIAAGTFAARRKMTVLP